jgi:hypothetical protein
MFGETIGAMFTLGIGAMFTLGIGAIFILEIGARFGISGKLGNEATDIGEGKLMGGGANTKFCIIFRSGSNRFLDCIFSISIFG